MNIRYRVELNAAERCELTALLSAGKHPARKLKRAQILLAADAGIDSRERLVSEIAAWERQRNKSHARIKWMFTAEKAREKMARAYPIAAKES